MTSVSDVPPPIQQVAPAPSKNSFQRIAGVFFTPASTFGDIARRPDILVPLIVVLVISIVSAVMIVPHVDFAEAIRAEIEKNPNIAADDADRIVRIGAASAKVFAYASPVMTVIVLAVVAGVLLLAFRMFAGEGTFRQAFSATLYAWFPLLVKSILTAVVALSRGTVPAEQLAAMIRSNPAFLVDMKAQPAAFVLLSSLDIFTIWTVVLLVIGFAALSKLEKMRSAVIIVSLWVIVILGRLGLATLAASRAART